MPSAAAAEDVETEEGMSGNSDHSAATFKGRRSIFTPIFFKRGSSIIFTSQVTAYSNNVIFQLNLSLI